MDKEQFLALAFMQLACWRLHPGYMREGASAPSLRECLEDALFMVSLYESEVSSWQRSQPPL